MEGFIANTQLLVDRIALLHRIPKNIVTCEIGDARGTYSRQIMRICQPKKHFLINSLNFSAASDDTDLNTVKEIFVNDIISGRLEIIQTDSISALMQLSDYSVDFIYIDTDHSYETTTKELSIAALKVKSDGFIAGHGYQAQGRYDFEQKQFIKYGVIEAVHEFMVNAAYDLVYLTNEPDGHLSYVLKKA